ncbi:MAG TPA: alginate lyase family protein [Phycisphaerae bacterium]|nr:alginate lyase family protein [Phycisphaerae bacterium]HOI54403.1 alginate lyase family protein [Phycisphaerae bacterium]
MHAMNGLLLGSVVVLVLLASASRAAEDAAWRPPTIAVKAPATYPAIAATAEELARLRAAWASPGPAHDALKARFARADEAMKRPLEIPPEGGQHNQWYQCEKCQMALQTVDAHHHKCPKCGEVYSGYPFDNVLYGRTHMQNTYRAEDAAWAWAVTGEKRYAEFAARVLREYAARYLKYAMLTASVGDKSKDIGAMDPSGWQYKSAGHMFEQTLNEAMWMINLVTAYDLIRDSGALSDSDCQGIERDLIRAVAANVAKNTMGKSNWQTWHNAALLWAGGLLGDEALVRAALTDPENGFVFQMAASVMPEGMWFENSWGYHYYTLMAMTHLAEGARRLGIDLWSHPSLKRMYLLGFDYRMGDGSLPRFGDAVQDDLRADFANEPAYAVYGDERILTALGTEPSWLSLFHGRDLSRRAAPAADGSKVFPGTGHALLRTDGPGRLSAAVSFGPYGGFHGHYDKQSFVFFGYGQELAVDPGRAKSQAYRLPIHSQWYKSTVGHNAVLVDGKDQAGATGQLLAFKANPSYAAVVTDDGDAYANVDHRRFLLLTPTYLLVVDELRATDNKEHTFEWLYHNLGEKASCDLPKSDATLGNTPGYGYLKDVAAYAPAAQRQNGSADSDADRFDLLFSEPQIRTVFKTEGLALRLTMVGRPGDQIFTATGPFRSVEDRVPVVIVRRSGKRAVFVAVLEPVPEGSQPGVRAVANPSGGLGEQVRVNRAAGMDSVGFLGNVGERFGVSSPEGEQLDTR